MLDESGPRPSSAGLLTAFDGHRDKAYCKSFVSGREYVDGF